MRLKRNTAAPGDRPSAIASSGFTCPAEREIQLLLDVRPRAAMSSLNDDSFEKLFSTRPATNVPAPRRRVSSPSSTSPPIALRTVIRETSYSIARSRSAGIALPCTNSFSPIALRISCCSWR